MNTDEKQQSPRPQPCAGMSLSQMVKLTSWHVVNSNTLTFEYRNASIIVMVLMIDTCVQAFDLDVTEYFPIYRYCIIPNLSAAYLLNPIIEIIENYYNLSLFNLKV
ncbi:hypothetical protein PHYBLDRAFT_171744 [Phycomyces blakesleeanus NRRL 1555(-)]|uniref:Uncharacterized protein n=1 Tax=Phycomyces blakesleeanus (strain ATCC 8743b / DSM 1359 / FGSC 10004 / NBRC 33097 / NRRL 1555) TaxID=763407 RepID=A0A162PML8_PHYB8|nr:hypothetical protein PHYBLDRAFT_171744 [Phycomyces blakesleeanus NRRL 1555(-)]OAD70366.1 hypothetical protein PHYBLDRAFT_171744 [Phycomyces blakesleeanus NRRL 1555(-)]|eukprot:XP_018288406.1 hypothetical protein PHYBLDRAFT_171744 [Phycomyces blakesleeanus NRRL 1555(-)]